MTKSRPKATKSPTATALDVRSALKQGIAQLDAAAVPSSALAAEIFLIYVLGRDRTWLYTHASDPLEQTAWEKYSALLTRRASGEPTQYLIGTQEFWGLEFEVTPAVLIPRPETEHLIEVAVERIGVERREARLGIADVGTGSGGIAVALAKEFPNAEILATDISAAALEVARRNASRHGATDRIEFIEADLLHPKSPDKNSSHSPLITRHSLHSQRLFDLIISNPPYIAESEAESLQREVRDHEPAVALFGGVTGLEIYERLIEQAEDSLVPGGLLVVELGYGAAERVREFIAARGAWTDVSVTNDLAGIPRVLAAAKA